MSDKAKTILKKIFFSYTWLALVVFVVDITTKWVVQNNLADNEEIVLIPNFLWITKTHNLGAAFSLGNGGETWMRILWIAISLIMSVAILIYYIKQRNKVNAWYKAALMLMFAGAVGNLIDRAFYWNGIVGFDGVIDWIKVTKNFPVFNIADSALVIGVIIIIVLIVIELIKDAIKKGKSGAYELTPEQYNEKMKKEEENKENSSNNDENNKDK